MTDGGGEAILKAIGGSLLEWTAARVKGGRSMQHQRIKAVICTVCFVLGALSFGIGQMDAERYYLFGVWGIGLMCAAALMWLSFVGLFLIFWTAAILACVQVMLNEAFVVGFAALVGCTLCSIGGAGLGSLVARREKRYRGIVLFGIGAIGLIAIAAGLAVMMSSGVSMRLFGAKKEIDGVTWAIMAACTGLLVMTKKEAIWGGVRS